MPSGQVSVWVPIVVAVLGIVGIIGGQLINAWREDRRWQRELRREDQRWERERAHDNVKELRQQRIDLYTRYLAAFRYWHQQLDAYRFRVVFNKDQKDLMEGIPVAEILTSHANVAEALAMIEFVASDHVVEVAADVYQNTMPGHLALTRAVRKVEDVTSLSGGNYTERVEMVARLIEAFRQDLGTSGATMVDLDPSN